jgi:hypothetical protein
LPRWAVDDEMITERGDRIIRHAASPLHRPLILLEQDGTDHADDRLFPGEDAGDSGPPLDLAIQAFERVGWMSQPPCRTRREVVAKADTRGSGGSPAGAIVAAPGRLAIDGDKVRNVGPCLTYPGGKRGLKRLWAAPVHQDREPAVAGTLCAKGRSIADCDDYDDIAAWARRISISYAGNFTHPKLYV